MGKPGNNLFIAGFNFITTERDLERKFSRYGRVMDVRIVRDKRYAYWSHFAVGTFLWFVPAKPHWQRLALKFCIIEGFLLFCLHKLVHFFWHNPCMLGGRLKNFMTAQVPTVVGHVKQPVLKL